MEDLLTSGGCHQEVKSEFKKERISIGLSSNGRILDFESSDAGSNPAGPAK